MAFSRLVYLVKALQEALNTKAPRDAEDTFRETAQEIRADS
jgi:hypothetical protein